MKLKILIPIAILLMIATSFIAYSLLSYYYVYDIAYIPINFQVVDDSIGFDLNNSQINLGLVPLGGSSSRNITVINEFSHPVKIQIESVGEGSEWIRLSQSSFPLEKGMNQDVEITTTPSIDAKLGEYSPVCKIYFLRT